MRPPQKPRRGRNWQYQLGADITLLRNIGSVDPKRDGWWLNAGARRTRITGARALRLLLAFRGRANKSGPL